MSGYGTYQYEMLPGVPVTPYGSFLTFQVRLMGSVIVYCAAPRPAIVPRGKAKLRLPEKRLTLSNPLKAYEPTGEPASIPGGKIPSAALRPPPAPADPLVPGIV